MTRVFGVTRNYQGTVEYRYLYTGEELVHLENECHKTFGIQNEGFFPDDIPLTVTVNDLDGMESSFWSNDTYTVTELKTEEEIREFLTTPCSDVCDYENPPLNALAETWSELSFECMFTGDYTQTLADWMQKFGLSKSDCAKRDARYDALLCAGMPEEDFSLPWPDDDKYRYAAVMKALEQNTYGTLKREMLAETKANTTTDIAAMEVPVPGGVLRATKSTDPEYPGIDIEFIAAEEDSENGDFLSRPRVLVEYTKEDKELRTLIWNNPKSEDYSDSVTMDANYANRE